MFRPTRTPLYHINVRALANRDPNAEEEHVQVGLSMSPTIFSVPYATFPPKLGFPWILSSETSLFNGLHGVSAKNFSRGVSSRSQPESEPAAEAMRKVSLVHGASLTWLLIFSNRLLAAAARFRPLSRRRVQWEGGRGMVALELAAQRPRNQSAGLLEPVDGDERSEPRALTFAEQHGDYGDTLLNPRLR